MLHATLALRTRFHDKVVNKKVSVLGLALVVVSTITGTNMPSKYPIINNGHFLHSNEGLGQQKTCVPAFNFPVCTVAVNSATTQPEDDDSTSANQAKSGVLAHSSGSPE